MKYYLAGFFKITFKTVAKPSIATFKENVLLSKWIFNFQYLIFKVTCLSLLKYFLINKQTNLIMIRKQRYFMKVFEANP